VDEEVEELLRSGPHALAATKQLIAGIAGEVSIATMEETAQLIADLRVSEEGQEGLRAFTEQRKPGWRDTF